MVETTPLGLTDVRRTPWGGSARWYWPAFEPEPHPTYSRWRPSPWFVPGPTAVNGSIGPSVPVTTTSRAR
jgi:hypothetical protein